MEKSESSVPRRKASGWIGGLISMLVQLVVWLLVSLLLSYLIEWTGMAFFWQAEGERHSQAVLASDLQYLNAHLQHDSLILKKKTILYAIKIKEAVADISWERRNKLSDKTLISSSITPLYHTLKNYAQRLEPAMNVAVTVTQIFVIRLAIIVLSLPIFLIAAIMGAVDGLVQRDLRRWGGGRESSNVFNLAKRSIAPFFVLACVIYISLPFSINPIIVILPFACLLGMAVRIAFERLKKYF